MICPACGSAAPTEDARHCHRCGAPLSSESPPVAAQVWHQPQHPSGLSSEVRNWALAAHLSAFAGALVALAFVGPLVVWLVKREEHPFIAEHGREALNFNLSVLLYGIVFTVLAFVLIGIPLLIALGIFWLVVTILAAVRASNGESYRYPLTIRFF